MSTDAPEATGAELPHEPARGITRPLWVKEETGRQRNEDRIRELVNALGDPNHPLHSVAINELVAIGPKAVSALGAALSPDRPWLMSFRAAEALAQIGDGGASGALMTALRHPNSNVRWSAVRALAEVGDTRTLWALRRIVHEDRGKTSWGESVADTAQQALDRLQSRSALLRFNEPIKTALVFVAMLAAMIFAANRVQAVIAELRRDVSVPTIVADANEDATAGPDETALAEDVTATVPAAAITATTSVTPTATAPPLNIGTVVQSGRVRSGPSLQAAIIGNVFTNDQVIFLASDPQGNWFRVRLGPVHNVNSIINGDGEGWVNRILLKVPPQPVPTQQPSTR